MSNVMDAFQHLDGMSQTQLFERRQTIIGTAPDGDYKRLDDNALQELVAIHRVLRRKTSVAGKATTSRKGPNLVPTLDNI